jgi:hypothetical protein
VEESQKMAACHCHTVWWNFFSGVDPVRQILVALANKYAGDYSVSLSLVCDLGCVVLHLVLIADPDNEIQN